MQILYAFQNVETCLNIFDIMPTTNSSSERSFKIFIIKKKNKSNLRSTFCQKKLNVRGI